MSEKHLRQTHLTADEIEAAAERSAALPGPRTEHVRSCAACAREVDGLRRLSEALRALPATGPAPGFADRVMARVELPLPWHRRLAVAVRERTAAGVGLAATLAALVAGAGLWAVRFPDLTPLTLAGWLAGRAGDFALQLTMGVGRVAYALGLTDIASALTSDLTLTSLFAAAATVALVGAGSLSVMIRLLRQEPDRPELARAR